MIVFQNDGLIDLRSVSMFGLSAKPNSKSPIGYFGTGLKYAIAVILRSGGAIRIYRGRKVYGFATRASKFRGEQMTVVTMNGETMPFGIEVGKTWEPWQAYRELHANTLDEGGTIRFANTDPGGVKDKTTIVVEGADFDHLYETRRNIFLEGDPLHKQPGLEVHFGESGVLYYKGMRAMQLNRRSMFTWNITSPLELTEDRTVKYHFIAESLVERGIVRCDNAEIISQCLQAKADSWEGNFDYDLTNIEASSTFMNTAANLKAANAPFSKGAAKLFTAQARVRGGYIDHISAPPSLVESALYRRARDLLSSRMAMPWPNIPVLIVEGRERPMMVGGRLEVPSGFFDLPTQAMASAMLVSYANTSGNAAPRLADFILTGSFFNNNEQGQNADDELV